MEKSSLRKIILPGLTLGVLAVALIPFFSAMAEEIPRIKPEELKKLIDTKADIVVVDNQPKLAYDMEHIPGAVNLPWAQEIRGPVNLPRDKVLVLYCACEHEEDSTHVANQLVKKYGYKNVKLLEGGWLKWVKLAFPAEKGKGE
jgi:rhodanese-related sulfurtransferase